MRADSRRWREVAKSPFPHEQEGLARVRERLPEVSPYQAWSNLEFVADDGTANEVDLLVLGPGGLYLVELKYYPGRVAGDGQRWTYGDQARAVENPLLGANRKARRLRSLLDRAARGGSRARVPFVRAAVLLHNPSVRCGLDDVGRQGVYGLDGPEGRGNGLPPLVEGLLTRPATDGRDLVDHPRAQALVRLMDALHFGPGDRRRLVGTTRIDPGPLAEGRGWQDYLGHPDAAPEVTRRVRIYRPSRGASADERATVRRATEREFRLLQGIGHRGITRPTDIAYVDDGTALVFDWVDGQVPLDAWLAVRGADLSTAQRLALVRQLAETVKYAHDRRLVHRALAPRAVWVLDPGSADPELSVGDWQAAGREAADASATGTAHLDRVVDVPAESYLAPELARDPGAASPRLDVFGLGALTYTVFAGRAPAETHPELMALLEAEGGLELGAVDVDVPESLRALVLEATWPDPGERPAGVDDFLRRLDDVEAELLRRDGVVSVDPLDAQCDDVLDGAWRVVRRLGRGSTAVALLVRDAADEDADPLVLKVALDADKADRLRAEAAALDGLGDDTKVVQLLYPPVVVGGRDALVLEFAGEETLAHELATSGALHPDRLERYGRDLLDIAAYLDRTGVRHRDVKPANLGIRQRPSDRTKHLVIFDFSLAGAGPEQIRAGTPAYLDPFLGPPARPRYDDAAERFAVAVTLYEMATGTLPRWGDDGAHPGKISAEVTVEADLVDPGLRGPLAAFFARALARDASARYGTVEDMARAWAAAFEVLDRAPAVPAAPVPAAPVPAAPVPAAPVRAASGGSGLRETVPGETGPGVAGPADAPGDGEAAGAPGAGAGGAGGEDTVAADPGPAPGASAAPDAPAPGASAAGEGPVGLTEGSPVVDAGLTRRAVAALERRGVYTVGDLVAANAADLARMRGVNQATTREIGTVAKALRARFRASRPGGPAGRGAAPGSPGGAGSAVAGPTAVGPAAVGATAVEATAVGPAAVEAELGAGRPGSVDAVLAALLPGRPAGARGPTPARRALALHLGMADPAGPGLPPLDWPSRALVAARLGVPVEEAARLVRAAVAGRWAKDPVLAEVRDRLVELLDLSGGVMTVDELGAALLAERGSVAKGDLRACQARGLVRAAVDVELVRGGDARIDVRRVVRGGRGAGGQGVRARDTVLVGREPDDPDDLPAAARLDHALALGAAAARLASDDPLPDAAAVARALAAVPRPDGVDPLPEQRLAPLAAAVAGVAVTTDRRLYPPGMPAARALRLVGLPPGAGRDGVDPFTLSDRAYRRFPQAEPLPARPALDAVVRDAGFDLEWDPATDRYRAAALAQDASAGTVTRLTAAAADGSPGAVDGSVRDQDRRIADALRRGRMLVAVAPPGLLDRAAAGLAHRHGLHRFDVTRHLVDAARAEAARRGVRWDVVLAADAAAPGSRDRENLARLLAPVLAGVGGEVAAVGGPVVLTDAEPLARYDRLGDLAGWIADGRPPAPGVLLVPADGHGGAPHLDGQTVPAISDAQWIELGEGWLRWAPGTRAHGAGADGATADGATADGDGEGVS